MINLSISTFIQTFIAIIMGSPSSFLFVVLGIVFTIAMIVNVKKNKTIGKTLFMGGWIFIILFILLRYNSYFAKIVDNLINYIFRQIFFPNLAIYLLIIFATNYIFVSSILKNKEKNGNKIIDSIFFLLIMIIMIFTLETIIEGNVNVYTQEEVYTNQKLLVLIESTTLLFLTWMVILFSKYILHKLIQKSDEKIIEKYEKDNPISAIKKANPSMQLQPQTIGKIQTPRQAIPKKASENTEVLDFSDIS